MPAVVVMFAEYFVDSPLGPVFSPGDQNQDYLLIFYGFFMRVVYDQRTDQLYYEWEK
jgi:hypothetical protein